MKKLKLKLSGVKEMLSREQMKKVSGGYSGLCPGYITCSADDWMEHYIGGAFNCDDVDGSYDEACKNAFGDDHYYMSCTCQWA